MRDVRMVKELSVCERDLWPAKHCESTCPHSNRKSACAHMPACCVYVLYLHTSDLNVCICISISLFKCFDEHCSFFIIHSVCVHKHLNTVSMLGCTPSRAQCSICIPVCYVHAKQIRECSLLS